MSRSVELVFRLRTEGREQAEAVLRSIRGLSSEIEKGSASFNSLAGASKTVDGAFQALNVNMAKALTTLGASPAVVNAYTQGITNAAELTGAFSSSTLLAAGAAAGLVVGLAAATGSAVNFVNGMGDAAEKTQNLADRLGVSISLTQKWQAMARIAGVSIDSLAGASRAMGAALEDSAGSGAKVSDALRKMGVATYDTSGNQREMGAVLADTLVALSKISNNSERVFLAQAVLTRGAARELLPLIANYKELSATVANLGVGDNEGLVKALGKANDEVDKLSVAWDRFKQQLAGAIAPVVIPVVTQITAALRSPEQAAKEALTLAGSTRSSALIGAASVASLIATFSADGLTAEQLANAGKKAKDPFTVTTLQEGAAIAQRVRESIGNTKEGLTRSLQQVEKQMREIENVFNGSPLTADAAKTKEAELNRLRAQADSLKARLKKFSEDARLGKKSEGDEEQAEKRLVEQLGKQLNPLERINLEHEGEIARLKKKGELTEKLRSTLEKIRDLKVSETNADGFIGLPLSRRSVANEIDDRLAGITSLTRLRLNNSSLESNFQAAALESLPFPRIGNQSATTIAQALREQFKQAEKDLQFGVDRARLQSELDVRRYNAFARPDEQVSVIEKTAARRLQAASEVQALEGRSLVNNREYELETIRIRGERELELAELRKRSVEQYRDSAGRVYDALRAGGSGGLTTLLRGQLDIQGRALFQNISTNLFSAAGSTLGRIGQQSGLGSLLRGTLFDPQNATLDQALTRSADSTDNLTGAVVDLTSTMRGASATLGSSGIPIGLGGYAVPGFISDATGLTGQGNRTIASLFSRSDSFLRLFAAKPLGITGFGGGRITGVNSPEATRLADFVRGGGLGTGIVNADGTVPLGVSGGSTLSTLQRSVGIAGSLAAGGVGVYAGVRQGGLSGALTASGSALGATAALLPLLGATGPLAPILAGAALGVGLLKGFLPDPKKQREEFLASEIKARRYEAPVGRNADVDLAGNEMSADKYGRARVVVIQNINALDAQSLMDRKRDIANAVGSALREGGTDLGDGIRGEIYR